MTRDQKRCPSGLARGVLLSTAPRARRPAGDALLGAWWVGGTTRLRPSSADIGFGSDIRWGSPYLPCRDEQVQAAQHCHAGRGPKKAWACSAHTRPMCRHSLRPSATDLCRGAPRPPWLTWKTPLEPLGLATCGWVWCVTGGGHFGGDTGGGRGGRPPDPVDGSVGDDDGKGDQHTEHGGSVELRGQERLARAADRIEAPGGIGGGVGGQAREVKQRPAQNSHRHAE
eukprot:scaffold3806_cov94-Isochrysis_galbana.AAC.2